MPVIEISAALLFERKSAYFKLARTAQMYSSNRLRRSSSLPRYDERCPSGYTVSSTVPYHRKLTKSSQGTHHLP